VLIVFGTTEGHTRKLAEFAAAKLTVAGYKVTLRHAPDAERTVDVGEFPLVFITASLHWGRYQNSITDFVLQNHEALNARSSAFISASLSAAGVAQPEKFTLDDCVSTFEHETLWTPRALHHAAGGIRHTAYDYFKRLTAKLIAEQRGDPLGLSDDYDLTDYGALSSFVLAFAKNPPQAASSAKLE
jgi:menaquinone-dependent protoporphyrinogen oxidase